MGVFLGAFAKGFREIDYYLRHVRLSVRAMPTGRIFVKSRIWDFY